MVGWKFPASAAPQWCSHCLPSSLPLSLSPQKVTATNYWQPRTRLLRSQHNAFNLILDNLRQLFISQFSESFIHHSFSCFWRIHIKSGWSWNSKKVQKSGSDISYHYKKGTHTYMNTCTHIHTHPRTRTFSVVEKVEFTQYFLETDAATRFPPHSWVLVGNLQGFYMLANNKVLL